MLLRLYYSGATDGGYEHGVGIIIQNNMANLVINFIPVNKRIMLLQVSTSPVNTKVTYKSSTHHRRR